MIEIARITTFATANRRDIVRRLMGTSRFFKNLEFHDALAAFRYAETHGLVTRGDGWLAVYHNCEI